MLTRGLRRHATVPTPAAATAARRAGVSLTPANATESPAATSPPRGRTCAPGSNDCEMSTVFSTWTTSSMGTTASAPSGTTAPVEMAAAQPSSSRPSKGRPAADSPTIRSVAGRSAARTAKPSIAELANGGRSTRALTSSAATRPDAAPIGTGSAASGRTRSSTRSCASSRLSSEVTDRSLAAHAQTPSARRRRWARNRRSCSRRSAATSSSAAARTVTVAESTERADVDLRVALARDVFAQRVESGVEIGRQRERHGHLGERLATADRRVDDRVGGELAVRHDESPAIDRPDERVGEADLLDDAVLCRRMSTRSPMRTGCVERDEDPGDEVAERPLRGEADDRRRAARTTRSRPPATARTWGMTSSAEKRPDER